MRFLAHALTALCLLLVPAAANAAQPAAAQPAQQTPTAAPDTGPKPFAHHEVAQDAERYESYLKGNWILAGRKAVDLLDRRRLSKPARPPPSSSPLTR